MFQSKKININFIVFCWARVTDRIERFNEHLFHNEKLRKDAFTQRNAVNFAICGFSTLELYKIPQMCT